MVRVKKRPREGHTRPLGAPAYRAELARVHSGQTVSGGRHAAAASAPTSPRLASRANVGTTRPTVTGSRAWAGSRGRSPRRRIAAAARDGATRGGRGHGEEEVRRRPRRRRGRGAAQRFGGRGPGGYLVTLRLQNGRRLARPRDRAPPRTHLVPFDLPKRAKPS